MIVSKNSNLCISRELSLYEEFCEVYASGDLNFWVGRHFGSLEFCEVYKGYWCLQLGSFLFLVKRWVSLCGLFCSLVNKIFC